MARIERPKSLTELVANVLREEIIDGRLDLGQALSEVAVAKRLEVSRTPVREAFARLELEGLVRTEPHRGTFVFTLSARYLDDIRQVRAALEPVALRLSMLKSPNDVVASLTRHISDMAQARQEGNAVRYSRLDDQFHQSLFDHADNPFLNDAYQTIASKVAVIRNRIAFQIDRWETIHRDHLEIVEAVTATDPERAVGLLVPHINRSANA